MRVLAGALALVALEPDYFDRRLAILLARRKTLKQKGRT